MSSDSEDEEVRDESLSDKHQALLQTFIARRIIEKTTLTKIITTIKKFYKDNSANGINDFIFKINPMIVDINLQIKELRTENHHYWCLTNLKPDDASKLTTKYNANETTFFKLMIETLLNGGGEARVSQIIDHAKEASFNSNKAETALEQFKTDGWVKSSSQSTVILSERALLDLSPLMTNLPECVLCHQRVLVINHYIKECKNCQTKFHQHCSDKYFQKNAACPSCNQKFESN